MPSLQVRDLPDYIYQQIIQLAEAERRSIAQETIILLEKALQLEKSNKKRRSLLFNHIIQETKDKNYKDALDPVKLIREDRER
ncbi:hypothetical protein AN618_01300 [Fervidicola ferrireducens]|uniref:CopG-like ribbon-helix-helix domain-containing protein n=1 Tax=Fervidicola ferrireducens TaxID=520764 RepID=A0A140LE17_9FIRM|nr:hypothetical protein [Fervidicola ferrireducens]KXG78792.1 hypothetical protein AN618_01300 [Fervidicola ferrireducens]